MKENDEQNFKRNATSSCYVRICICRSNGRRVWIQNQSLVKAGGRGISTQWLDKDGKALPFDAPLTVMQGKPENFKFRVYRANGLGLAIDFDMNILDSDYNSVSDPALILQDAGYCKFDLSISQNICNFTLIANDTNTIGQARHIIAQPSNSSIANSSSIDINIIENNLGGTIIGTGPSNETNVLTAMAVSNIPANDKESFILKIDNLTNVKTINLAYQIEDTDIAQFESSETKTQTCNVDATDKNEVKCIINVIPLKTGNTKITFVDGKNYWIDTKGNKSYYESTQLEDIKVNIGSLYVGYESGLVYRKGATTFQLGNPGKAVKSLAVNGPNHMLFATSGQNIYKQNDFSNSDDIKLNILATLPTLNTTVIQNAQVFSLTNESNTLLVGTDKKRVYTLGTNGTITPNPEKTFNFLINSGVTDTFGTKINFFVDAVGDIHYRDEKGSWTDIDNEEVLGATLQDFNIAAQNNIVYMSANNPGAARSELFLLSQNKLSPVITDDTFTEGNYIVSLFHDGNSLFATSNNGMIYKLIPDGSNFKWQLINYIVGVKTITDIAIDINRNIYLSTPTKGIYKLKPNADGTYKANPLSLYNDKGIPTAIVIDNNIQ